MTRSVAIVVAAAALTLAACGGGDGGSKGRQTPSATSTTSATNTSASQGARPKRKLSSAERTALAPKPGTPRLTGQRQVAYLKARAACGSAGVGGIARRYGLAARNPAIVARLYSHRAFAPPAQGAGFAGCLTGFR